MNRVRPGLIGLVCLCALANGCSKALPPQGVLTAASDEVTATGEYRPIPLDAVERMTIDDGKLVIHGASGTLTLDLPPTADPEQQNRGWALVTEGESDEARSLTFTHETTLEDFTIEVPRGEGQVAYGSLGGRDGHDVLLFAYGSAPNAYFGWITIVKKSQS